MRYQIQVIDQNLPGLTREMARACWNAADMLAPAHAGRHLYRSLYRAIRRVLKSRIHAFKYCGATRICEQAKYLPEFGKLEWHEKFAPEDGRIHRYLCAEDAPPSRLVIEILREALKTIVHEVPARNWKGLASILRRQIEKSLHGRVLRSEFCGESPLCMVNEPIDPWDLREPVNRIARD